MGADEGKIPMCALSRKGMMDPEGNSAIPRAMDSVSTGQTGSNRSHSSRGTQSLWGAIPTGQIAAA